MKIIEQSASRLVIKQGAQTKQIVGSIIAIAGVGLIIGGIVSGKVLGFGLIGLIAGTVGVLLALFSKATTIIADNTARTLTATFTSLLNKTGKSNSCNYDQVAAVLVSQDIERTNVGSAGAPQNGISFGNSGSTSTQMRTTLLLQLKDSTTWTLASETHDMNGGVGSVFDHIGKAAQLLADTLGVPLQRSGEQTIGQAVSAVRDMITGNTASTAPAATPTIVAQPTVVAPTAPLQPVVQPAQPPQPQVAQPITPSPAPTNTESDPQQPTVG